MADSKARSNSYIPVYTAYGQLAGEMIRLLLESNNIPAMLSQESAGATYGLTFGPLGEVKVLVPARMADEARQILQDMEEGKLEEELYPGKYTFRHEYKQNKLPHDEIFKEPNPPAR